MEKKPPRVRSMKFNVLMNVLLVTSTYVFPILIIPYVSRTLGPEKMGTVSFAIAFTSYFSLVAILGISTYGIRACAKVRDNALELSRVVRELLRILYVSTSVVYISYIVVIFTVPRFSNDSVLFLITSISIILTSLGVEWFYQALEQYGYITGRSIAVKTMLLLLVFVFVRNPGDYHIYAALTVFGSAGSNIINIVKLHSMILSKGETGPINPWRHLRPVFHYAVSAISIGMYVQADILMLGFMGTTSMVGIYQLASKIETFAAAGSNAVSGVMLPRLSYYSSSGNRSGYISLFTKNLQFILIISLFAAPLLAICAGPIVQIMGGADFMDAVLPLIFISPGVVFISVNTAIAQHMVSLEMDAEFARLNMLGLFSAIVLNALLIPRFGAVGSAISSAGAELVVLLPKMWITRDVLRETWKDLRLGKIVVASILAMCGALLFDNVVSSYAPLLHLLATTAIYVLIYTCVLALSGEPLIKDAISTLRGYRFKRDDD